MGKLKVVITDYVFEPFDQEKEVLAGVGAELMVLQCKTLAELKPHLADTHALLNTYLKPIGKEVFAGAPNLKIVVRYGIGVDTISIPEATAAGVMVANVPDYCMGEVADHALAHFLCLVRKIAFSDRRVKGGEWLAGSVKPIKAIDDMTVGIIGFGRIGRAIAQRLKPFGPRIVFADPVLRTDQDGCRKVELNELYETCDAIVVQCPATPETQHLLNRDAFARMKKKPLIINCARGQIIETEALVWALQCGLVSGAGLDVIEEEATFGKQDHPLKTFDSVVLTPHTAWYSVAAGQRLQRKAAEEVARVLRGERPLSLLNPEVWKGK